MQTTAKEFLEGKRYWSHKRAPSPEQPSIQLSLLLQYILWFHAEKAHIVTSTRTLTVCGFSKTLILRAGMQTSPGISPHAAIQKTLRTWDCSRPHSHLSTNWGTITASQRSIDNRPLGKHAFALRKFSPKQMETSKSNFPAATKFTCSESK